MHCNALSTVVLTCSSPFWCTELHPLIPSSCHQLSSCTNARLRPPFLPESTTQTWQPSRFMNELMPSQMPPSHRQTNNANLLHPCMPASPLWCMTPSIRSGSLPLWYVSCWKTATKCAPVMAWSISTWDDTFMNIVSSPLTLPQMSQEPHCRLLPDLTFLHQPCTPQACTTAAASASCACNACDSKTTDTSCPWQCPCAYAYVCNTQHIPCAALEIWPCLHCTQAPDPGSTTALQPTWGEPWLGMSPGLCYLVMCT